MACQGLYFYQSLGHLERLKNLADRPSKIVWKNKWAVNSVILPEIHDKLVGKVTLLDVINRLHVDTRFHIFRKCNQNTTKIPMQKAPYES